MMTTRLAALIARARLLVIVEEIRTQLRSRK
jgi:hypothetical protein